LFKGNKQRLGSGPVQQRVRGIKLDKGKMAGQGGKFEGVMKA